MWIVYIDCLYVIVYMHCLYGLFTLYIHIICPASSLWFPVLFSWLIKLNESNKMVYDRCFFHSDCNPGGAKIRSLSQELILKKPPRLYLCAYIHLYVFFMYPIQTQNSIK